MGEENAASQLRLSSARRRIDAFIEQIDVLAASSFPHDDGRAALAAIRKHCKDLQADLDLPVGVRTDVVDHLCLNLLDKVDKFTAILGFILRSTNVRNPFELHYIVKKLVSRALDGDVSLLISSEWTYVPFTYPMSVDQLPDAILIGTPAPESGNPLLIPLAGHEVGHSAWRMYGCSPLYARMANQAVKEEIDRNKEAGKALLEAAPLKALDKDRVINQCAGHVMEQLEEIFCDLFGLYLFGYGFIAAFDYLLGPGGHVRGLDYPSDDQRMAILVEAAGDKVEGALDLRLDAAMAAHWTVAAPSLADKAGAEIVDAVTRSMVPQVRTDLFARLQSLGINPPQQHVIDNVLQAFERGEPYPERVELGEIVSAGWHRLRALDLAPCRGADEEEKRGNRSKSYKVLADLVLKTIEVAEYHDRIAGHA